MEKKTLTAGKKFRFNVDGVDMIGQVQEIDGGVALITAEPARYNGEEFEMIEELARLEAMQVATPTNQGFRKIMAYEKPDVLAMDASTFEKRFYQGGGSYSMN